MQENSYIDFLASKIKVAEQKMEIPTLFDVITKAV